MDAKESYKHCTACGLLKPLSAFVSGREKTGRLLYSNICNTCRQARASEDSEESGSREGNLSITHKNRDLFAENQNKHEEQKGEDLKDYVEEQDQTEAKKEAGRQEESAVRRTINDAAKKPLAIFLEKPLPTTGIFNPEVHPNADVRRLARQRLAAHAGKIHSPDAYKHQMDEKNSQNKFFADQAGAKKAQDARTIASNSIKKRSGMFGSKQTSSQIPAAEEAQEISTINQFIKGRWSR